MQDTPRNIYTKLGSNQPSSFRGEEFWIIVNDDRCQGMAIAHMAFGHMSWKYKNSHLLEENAKMQGQVQIQDKVCRIYTPS